MKGSEKLKRVAFRAYQWGLYMPSLALNTAAYASGASLTSLLVEPRRGRNWGVRWARLNSQLTGIQVELIHGELIDPEQSYVIVANHRSLVDIWVLLGYLGIDLRWVMKQELRRVPVFGASCEHMEHIYIDRSNRQAALASLEQAKRSLQGGSSVAFFPEGKRSRDGALLPFKKGAFHFALDMELPLLPITLLGTGQVLPPDSMSIYPGKVEIHVSKPIPIEPYLPREVEALSEAARAAIAAKL